MDCGVGKAVSAQRFEVFGPVFRGFQRQALGKDTESQIRLVERSLTKILRNRGYVGVCVQAISDLNPEVVSMCADSVVTVVGA